jgi:hypothetical protein
MHGATQSSGSTIVNKPLSNFYEHTRQLTASIRLLILVQSGGVSIPTEEVRKMIELMEVMAKVCDRVESWQRRQKSFWGRVDAVTTYMVLIAIGMFLNECFRS